MTTNNINTQRLDLFNGEFATELVTATRQRLQAQQTRRNRRIIAIGRSKHGRPFQVTAPVQPPADFAEAVAEVDSRRVTSASEWRDHDAIDDEVIGEEFSRYPFLY